MASKWGKARLGILWGRGVWDRGWVAVVWGGEGFYLSSFWKSPSMESKIPLTDMV